MWCYLFHMGSQCKCNWKHLIRHQTRRAVLERIQIVDIQHDFLEFLIAYCNVMSWWVIQGLLLLLLLSITRTCLSNYVYNFLVNAIANPFPNFNGGFVNYRWRYIMAQWLHDLQPIPDSKVHGANMGPIWGRQDPGGPHVGPMNLAIRDNVVWVWC